MSQDLSGDDDIGNIPLSDNENPRSDNEKDADNEETGTREIVDPLKKRIIRKPQPKLNAEKLRNKKGVQTIEKYFQGFKWHGKGYEASDLNKVMKRLEHWGHRLFPKYNFDDLLEKLENLGSKKEVQVFLIKYRKDMLTDDLIGENNNPDDENDVRRGNSPEPVDEFDLLIAEQIEKTKQINTSIRDEGNSSIFNDNTHKNLNESIKKTSPAVIIDDEMRKRIERNRQIALEKKMARMKATKEAGASSQKETTPNIPSKEFIPNENAVSATVDDFSQNMELTDSVEENRQLDLSKILVQAEGNDENTHENNFVENSDDNILLIDNTGHVENSSVQLDNYDKDVHHDGINLSSSHIENTQKEVNITTSGKRLFTNEELDKEIDDAVNQFMKRKRQSK